VNFEILGIQELGHHCKK